MELTNDNHSTKVIFRKMGDKLEIVIDEDFDAGQYQEYETYGDIDFEEFKKNIEKIETSIGYVTLTEEEK